MAANFSEAEMRAFIAAQVASGPRLFARCAREIPRPERQAMIERGAAVTMKRQAELLELSRSNVYNQARPVSERNLRLMQRIDRLHLEAISFQRSLLLC